MDHVFVPPSISNIFIRIPHTFLFILYFGKAWIADLMIAGENGRKAEPIAPFNPAKLLANESFLQVTTKSSIESMTDCIICDINSWRDLAKCVVVNVIVVIVVGFANSKISV